MIDELDGENEDTFRECSIPIMSLDDCLLSCAVPCSELETTSHCIEPPKIRVQFPPAVHDPDGGNERQQGTSSASARIRSGR